MNIEIETIHPIICKECPFFEIKQEKIYHDNSNYITCKNVNICRYVFENIIKNNNNLGL